MTDETRLAKGTRPSAIAAKALITSDSVIEQPVLILAGGMIQRIATRDSADLPADTLHLPTCTLASGFFDIHVHGAGGSDVMEATPAAISNVARTLARYGTASFLATTVTAGIDQTLYALDALANATQRNASDGEASVVGIHLEGPFISHAKRGVHPPQQIQPPSVDLFDRFNEAAHGNIRLVTIAPEVPGALDLIRHCASRGIGVSLGHSDALAAEARAGIAAGASSATHTFNAMRGLTQREPGMLGVVLDDDAIYAELICDGVHTTREAVRLWLRAKGEDRAILVTDGMSATGMPDGDYLLGGMTAQVKDGVASFEGALAGSVLTMDRAVDNVQEFTGCGLASAVRLATRNPIRMLGLQPDNQASFNIYNAAGKRVGSILRGMVL